MTLPDRRSLCLNRQNHTSGHSNRPWVLGKGERTEVVVHRRGIQVRRRCLNCGTNIGPIPMQAVWEWFGDLGIPYVRQGTDFPYPDCSYRGCTNPGEDLHHFAPRNTFTTDADNWPIMPLCREHHVAWHQAMDGYRWHRKAS